MSAREPHAPDIAAFVHVLFRHADEGSFVSLRAFDQHDAGLPAARIEGVRINGAGLAPVIETATRVARESANARRQEVFCPPIATFADAKRAAEDALVNGVCISVEIDAGNPHAALERLQGLLGPATVVVASGGECTDPETGEVHDKVHGHWRLSEPTREGADHALLKHARRLASSLVNADKTAVPLVHPLRWPGSWHLKAAPRLARIIAINPAAEVHLTEAADALQVAVEAAGITTAERYQPTASGAPRAPVSLLAGAVAMIPNAPDGWGDHWEDWNRMGMALYRATAGSAEGLELWRGWSATSPKHDDGACDARWQHFATSPPTKIGAGTIFFVAEQHGWERPAAVGGMPEEPEGFWDAGAAPQANDGQAETAAAPAGKRESKAPPAPLRLVIPTSLARVAVPERKWIVPDWAPAQTTTSLYGNGGDGKTLLMQQLMTSCATGRGWCGLPVEPCKSLALFCEDSEAELHRRQDAINAAYGLTFDDLGNMAWVSGIGEDNLLMTFGVDGRGELSPRFLTLEETALDLGAKLVVIDTAADVFGGNENDRSQVRQFVQALNRLAMRIDGAVLLCAHPSRAGLAGDMTSGSTGWSNSVRSRLSLTRPTGPDTEKDTPERILTRSKANYASIGVEVRLTYQAGALMPVHRPSGFAAVSNAARVEQMFLTLMERCAAVGIYVSQSKNAANFAPKQFAARPDRDGIGGKDFEAAMNRLFAAKRLKVESYQNAGRNWVQRIAVNVAAESAEQAGYDGL